MNGIAKLNLPVPKKKKENDEEASRYDADALRLIHKWMFCYFSILNMNGIFNGSMLLFEIKIFEIYYMFQGR